MLTTLIDNAISSGSPRFLSRFYKSVPRPLIDWMSGSCFRYMVKYAYKNSSFYRKKFDSLKIDPNKVRKPSDLGDFYTTTKDVVEMSEEFLCRKPQLVFESSGTTGRNKRVYFTQDEFDFIGKLNAAGFYIWGFNKNDRIMNAFEFAIWIPGMITQRGIEKSGIFGIAAGKIEPMEAYRRIPIYNINIIIGEPTWLIKLTELAEKHGSYPLKMIIGGAEAMPEAARPWMEKVWQGAKVKMVYASVESGGAIAFEYSDECGGYHINENDFLVEIADADKDGYGEVVFTTLSRSTMPLIRYRNRDISKIIEEKCPCGLPYKRLAAMRGRADEMVVASGGNLYPLMFEAIFKDISQITSDWQIVFRLHGIKEVMEFNLELKEPGAENMVKEKVFSNMKSKYPDLWKNLSLAIFETDFVFHVPGTIRAARKIIRLVDKRYVI